MPARLLCLACVVGTCWAIYANAAGHLWRLQAMCLAGEVAATAWGWRGTGVN